MASQAGNKHPFIEAIRAEHEDDSPRLIYADWLEENGGDPLEAARIRLTTEKRRIDRGLKALEEACDHEGHRVRAMKEKYGLDAMLSRYMDATGMATHDGYHPFGGNTSAFVEGVKGKASAIKRAFASGLLDREPIHYVCITEMDDPSVFNSKAWQKITALAYEPHDDLEAEQRRAGAETIMGHLPHMTHLQSLGGSFYPVQPILHLLTQSSFPHLKNLSVSYLNDREVMNGLIEATRQAIHDRTALPLPTLESIHSLPLGQKEYHWLQSEEEQTLLAKDLLRLRDQARLPGLDKAATSAAPAAASDVGAEEGNSPPPRSSRRNPLRGRTNNSRINPTGTEPDTGPSRG